MAVNVESDAGTCPSPLLPLHPARRTNDPTDATSRVRFIEGLQGNSPTTKPTCKGVPNCYTE